MGRTTAALFIAGLLGLGLVGCSTSTDADAPASDTPASDTPTSTESPAADTPSAADAADELCSRASDADGADVCVLENATSSDDLSFSSYRIVKLIGGSYDGAVEITDAQQVTVTDATFAADLTVDPRGGAVVKLSAIGGTLSVNGGEHVTLVKNTVAGDLLCADGVQADGEGNTVAGEVTGTCSRVA